MFAKKKLTIEKPLRSDHHHLYAQTKKLYFTQLGMVVLFIITLLLIFVLVIQAKQPAKIAVINTANGKSYMTVSQNYTHDLLAQNIIYYSKEFCEGFFNATGIEVGGARFSAVKHMHPDLIKELEIDSTFFNDQTVKGLRESKAISYFKWSMPPQITVTNDPRYEVFCQFERTIKRKNYKDHVKKYNLVLNWVRFKKNINPMEKPAPLYLIKLNDIEENSIEMKRQLELIGK